VNGVEADEATDTVAAQLAGSRPVTLSALVALLHACEWATAQAELSHRDAALASGVEAVAWARAHRERAYRRLARCERVMVRALAALTAEDR
jgi:hypothetical protein